MVAQWCMQQVVLIGVILQRDTMVVKGTDIYADYWNDTWKCGGLSIMMNFCLSLKDVPRNGLDIELHNPAPIIQFRSFLVWCLEDRLDQLWDGWQKGWMMVEYWIPLS